MTVVSINLHPKRFPPGSCAIHRLHGWCEVLSGNGDKRRIRWVEHVPESIDDLPDPVETLMGIEFTDVILQETIVTHEALVCADDLRAA